MKLYVEVYNKRSSYLKELLKKDYVIVDEKSRADYIITKNKGENCISFQEMNENPSFRHLNNTLTAFTLLKMIQPTSLLILGYGNLAKQIARLFDCPITIANRNNKDHEEIIKQYRHLDLNNVTGSYDIVINTIPDFNQKLDISYRQYLDLAGNQCLVNYQRLYSLPDVYYYQEGAHLMKMYIDQVIG